jgi:hypothetical protein
MITNQSIAKSILLGAAQLRWPVAIEEITPGAGAAYEGASAAQGTRLLQVYLCDDDMSNPIWMIDTMDVELGEVNPRPLTGESLEEALAWLLAP